MITRPNTLFLLVLLLGGLGLGGCASNPAQSPAPETRAEAPPPAPAPVIPPPEVTEALLPPLALPETRAPAEPRFDIDVTDVSARAFFMGLVKDSPYNMVVHPSVEGQISLTLSGVTIPEVMDVVRQVYGFEYERHRTGYLVMPARLQARIFHVNYLNLRRDGESQTRVSSGETRRDRDGLQDGLVGGARGSAEAFGTRVRTETASDFWNELDFALRSIVGDGEGRSVVVTPQSNLVVVRGLPSELREVEAYLADVQGNMNRQVILEAKIVEVVLSDGFQAGINWAALGRPRSDSELLFGQTGGGTIFGETGRSDIAGQTGNLDPNNLDPVNNALTSAFGGVFSVAARVGDFTAFIELLETQGEVQVLSSPRVSTVNNQKAVIKVGADEFFVTDISSTTVVGTAATTSPNVTLTPFFSGIALDVTPQISREGDVILHIHPTVSEVTEQSKNLSLGGDTQSVPLALSTVRESDSIVRARSGQIVVIGGLMTETSRDRQANTPVLGRIPVVGNLFRHTQRSSRKTELVILLRPVVVDRDSAWDQARGSERMRELMRME
ncbi:pilus (MSHA type) biogenesis protein MshL [Thioalkalivibrio sulfidiphilus]|uniref:pilus (MSHA type) biogenesis protein MshL n=1 Tax=Thioalkalivibrio sulfidiphilus TaxID=1033854 RepID=UPI0003773C5E|nr:pilus (MSHA type) biogenesis protein MshL [Thioalkalivibrio sulfidiphilus]